MNTVGMRRLRRRDGSANSCAPSADDGKNVSNRSYSTDEGYGGECVNHNVTSSTAKKSFSTSQDAARGTEDIPWSSRRRDNVTTNLSSVQSTLDALSSRGPTKDVRRKNENRSVSMDDDYSSKAMGWGFPDDGKGFSSRVEDRSKNAPSSSRVPSQAFSNAGFTELASSSVHRGRFSSVVKGISTHEDQSFVTLGLAKAVPETVRRSSSKDDKHKKKETRTASKEYATVASWGYAEAAPETVKRKAAIPKEKEDRKVDTESPAKAVSVTTKHSSATDDQKMKHDVPKLASKSTRRSSPSDELYNPGHEQVLPTKRVTRSSNRAAKTVSKAVETAVKTSAQKHDESRGNEVKKTRGRKPRNTPTPVQRSTRGDEVHCAQKVVRSLSTDSLGIPGDNLPPVKRFTWHNEEYSAPKILRSRSTDSIDIPRDKLPPVKRFTWRHEEISAPKVVRSHSTDSLGIPGEKLPPVKRFTWRNEEYSAPRVARSKSTDSLGIAGDKLPPVKRFTWRNEEYSAPRVARSKSTDSLEIPGEKLPPVKRFTWRNEEYSAPRVIRSQSTDSLGIPGDNLPPVKRFTWRREEYSATRLVKSLSTDSIYVRKKKSKKRTARDVSPPFMRFTWRHGEYSATKLIKSYSTDSVYVQKKQKGKKEDRGRATRSSSRDEEHSTSGVTRWPSTDSIEIHKKRNKKLTSENAYPSNKVLSTEDEASSAALWLSTESIEIHKSGDRKTVSKSAQHSGKLLSSEDKDNSGAAKLTKPLSSHNIAIQKTHVAEVTHKDAAAPFIKFTWRHGDYSATKLVRSASADSIYVEKKKSKREARRDAQSPITKFTWKHGKCSATNLKKSLSTDSIYVPKRGKNDAPKDAPRRVTRSMSRDEEDSAANMPRWPSTDSIDIQKKRNKKSVSKDAMPSGKVIASEAEEYSAANAANSRIQKKSEEVLPKDPPAFIKITWRHGDYSATKLVRSVSADSVYVETKNKEDASPSAASRRHREYRATKLLRSLSTDSVYVARKGKKVVLEDTPRRVTRSMSRDEEDSDANMPKWPSTDSIDVQKKRNRKAISKDARPSGKVLATEDERCSAAKVSKPLSLKRVPVQMKNTEETRLKGAHSSGKMTTSEDVECSATRVTRWLSTESIEIHKSGARKTVSKSVHDSGGLLSSEDKGYSACKLSKPLPSESAGVQKKTIEETRPRDTQPSGKVSTSKDVECSAAKAVRWLSTESIATDKSADKKAVSKNAQQSGKQLSSKDEDCSTAKSKPRAGIQKKKTEEGLARPSGTILTSEDVECSAAKVARWLSTESIEIYESGDKKKVSKADQELGRLLSSEDNDGSAAKLIKSLHSKSAGIQRKKKTEETCPRDPSSKISTSEDEDCTLANLVRKRKSEATCPKPAQPSNKVLSSIPTHGLSIQMKRLERSVFNDASPAVKRSISNDDQYNVAKRARSLHTASKESPKAFPKSGLAPVKKDAGCSPAKVARLKEDSRTPVRRSISKDEDCSAAMMIRSFRAASKEIQRKMDAKAISKTTALRTSPKGDYYNTGLVRRSRSMDDESPTGVSRTSRRGTPLKTKTSNSLAKVTRSLSSDSNASSTSFVGAGRAQSFREEYYNTGLVRRSRSMDDDMSPTRAIRTSREDKSGTRCSSKTSSLAKVTSVSSSGEGTRRGKYYNTGLVRRSCSMDDDRRADSSSSSCSSNSEECNSLDEVERAQPNGAPSSTNLENRFGRRTGIRKVEYQNTALIRSCSLDDYESAPPSKATPTADNSCASYNDDTMERSESTMKRVRWANELADCRPGKLQRSVSMDCRESSNVTPWPPKSILKKTQPVYTEPQPRPCAEEGNENPKLFSFIRRYYDPECPDDRVPKRKDVSTQTFTRTIIPKAVVKKIFETVIEEPVDPSPRASTTRSKIITWSRNKVKENTSENTVRSETPESSNATDTSETIPTTPAKAAKTRPKTRRSKIIAWSLTKMDSSSKQMTSKDKTVRPKTPIPRTNRAVARKSFPTTSKKAAVSSHTKKSSELSNVVSLSEDDDEINDAPSVGDANKTHTASPTILVRSSSSDEAMTVGDRNTLSLTKRKRSASSEKKSKSQSSSTSSNVESTASSATATASSSKKSRPSSSKAKKSTTSSASTSSSNASESSGDNEPPKTRKRTAPKEDAARPSKVKRNSRRNWDDDSEDEYSPTGCRYKSPRREFGSRRMRDGFDCKICSRSFKGMTDLRRHLLIHAGEKPHVCEVCNKAYRQYVNLRNHMKVEHSKGKEFKCPFCMKPFALKLRLKLHLRIHIGEKPYICPNCPKTFGQEQQLTQHLKCHEVMAKNTCNLCSAKFPNEKAFKLHMETHADEDIDEILCQICDSTFESENVMVSHMTSSHGDLTHFECQICEKQIQDDLETHMKTHAPAKPHQCKICKKQFSQKNQHIIHMRTHTGERPYQCRVCWQSFGHSNVLKLHIRKHTGEKPFKCILCTTPTAFSQLAHLKGHLKSIHNHEGAYFCVGCKGSFKKKFLLDEHVKTCDEVEFQGPTKEEKKNAEKEADQLAQLRYLMAVLLKKISSKEKLDILGFEKRLIDNVVIAALELSGHKACNNKKVNPLDQMKLNIEAFLEWTVPKKIMHQFKKECPTIESILEKIVALYLKQVE